VKVKHLIQISANFCEVFSLKLPPFFVQNGFTLFVGCASTFIICRPAELSSYFVYLRAKKRRKTTTSDPGS